MESKKISELEQYNGSADGFMIPGVADGETQKANLGTMVEQQAEAAGFLKPDGLKTINGESVAGSGDLNVAVMNPFKGTYLDTDTLPTEGQAGDYIYVVNTSVTPRTANVYAWNGTAFADTGKSVEDFGQAFASGQAVNEVKIKDEAGEDVTGPAGVLSSVAGKNINDRFFTEPVDFHINSSKFTNLGFWYPTGTHNTTSTGYHTTDPIDVSAYDKLILSCHSYSVISPCVFLNDNNECVYAIPAPTEGLTNEAITIPKDLGAKYAVFSCSDSTQHYSEFAVYGVGIKTILTQDDIIFQSGQKLKDTSIATSLQSLDNNIPTVKAVNDALGVLPLYVEQTVDFHINSSRFTNIGFWKPDGTHNTSSTYYRTTDPIDVSAYDKLMLNVRSGNSTVSPCVFLNDNDEFVYGIPTAPDGLTNELISIPKNLGAKYAVFSSPHSAQYYSEFAVLGIFKISIANYVGKDSCYLSVTGNDENDGLTIETPVKTILRARQITTNTLFVMEGVYDYADGYNFNLTDFDKIVGVGNVVWERYQVKITSASLAEGKTKVYQAAIPDSLIAASITTFLWQDGIASMPIASNEKHPLQKDKSYRLPSTRMYPANSVDDIENESDGKLYFYADIANHVLYFSKTEDSDLSVNPIIIPSLNTDNWGYAGSQKRVIHIENINTRYAGIKTSNLSGEMINCSAGMCQGAAFVLTDSDNIRLITCEGYAAHASSAGDGFGTGVPTNGYTNITMYNCWGHDNRDDGESSHGNVSIVQYGGLYEYNGNGCTPAVGAKGTYHDVICRNNANHDWVFYETSRSGFSNQSVDGTGGMICFNCVAENSEIGFRNTNANSPSCCYNCIAINCTGAFSNIRSISSQVQSDWNETDNTKPSFIKNKPS